MICHKETWNFDTLKLTRDRFSSTQQRSVQTSSSQFYDSFTFVAVNCLFCFKEFKHCPEHVPSINAIAFYFIYFNRTRPAEEEDKDCRVSSMSFDVLHFPGSFHITRASKPFKLNHNNFINLWNESLFKKNMGCIDSSIASLFWILKIIK